ncbi:MULTISPECIES: DUF4198 domain-containing protein [unclassified Yoonia]|uniref:DUF4198 domain-containing protein n=1 Tax=unclassified Yoonia TaxID=2629118 RepID=UPI002AFF9045|nr:MULTISPECIES: DUF4198 domain-containing protein [unclassified Yoonia]
MRALSVIFCLWAAPAAAHEFWIAPLAYQVPSDSRLQANLVNGEDFAGVTVPYLPRGIVNAVQFSGDLSAGITGRPGDTPALQMDALGDGLAVLAYQSAPANLDYADWDAFQSFVDHKDLGDVRALHDARGLPDAGFTETYARYSKSLVSVGSGAGADRRVGLETELVALDNPYTVDPAADFAVQLFYRNDPRADAQIEVFAKSPDGTVTTTYIRTDTDGIARFAVLPAHEYMLDAVLIREPSPALQETTGAVWQTLWANLTFAVPQ